MDTAYDFGHIVIQVGQLYIDRFWNQTISFFGLTTTGGQIVIWSIMAAIFLKFLSSLIGDSAWF